MRFFYFNKLIYYNVVMEKRKKVVIGILAHVDAGKTTLIESLLYSTGSIKTLGRVDYQNAFLDFDKQERNRGITIYSKEAYFSFEDVDIYIIDTPGHVDFSSEMERVLTVLDIAIILVNGQDGVQVHSETIWQCLRQYHIPTMIFVNKMDISHLSRDILLKDIKKRFSHNCIDWGNDDFKNEVALCSDDLLFIYEKNGELTHKDLTDYFYQRSFFPVIFGSALKLNGVSELLKCIRYFSIDKQYPDEFGGRVYKISTDLSGTRLTHIKITGGILKNKEKIGEEKIDQIRLYNGMKYSMLNEASAGMIVCLKGLNNLDVGKGLGFEKDNNKPILNAYMNYRMIYPSSCDKRLLLSACRILAKEDPVLNLEVNDETQEIEVHIMGDMQLQMLENKIEELCGIQVSFTTGKIIYQETILDSVIGAAHFEPLKHYAEVVVRIEPLGRGDGIQISNEVSSDKLSVGFIKAILSSLSLKEHRGVLTGSLLNDVKITLIAGKGNLKHTEGGDFRQAASRAVRQALMKAKSILLEPYVKFEYSVHKDFLSKAIYDLEMKKTRFNIIDSHSDRMVIVGRGSMALFNDYQLAVNSYTKGLGRFIWEMDGYDVCINHEEVIKEINYNPELDYNNPADSVFCANGTVYTVKWDEVDNYIDIAKENNSDSKFIYKKEKIEEEELKRIFERANSNNRNFNKSVKAIKKIEAERPVKIVHLPSLIIVDGYNMIFSWDIFKEKKDDELYMKREKLLNLLFNYQGYSSDNMLVVFDGNHVRDNAGTRLIKGKMEIVYTSSNLTADAYIERFVFEKQNEFEITVVSSDSLIQNSVFSHGALRMSARELYQRILFVQNKINQNIKK